jgi:RND family efflux transporter MFP subunit
MPKNPELEMERGAERELRAEIAQLKRQVEEQQRLLHNGPHKSLTGPSARTLLALALVTIALIVVGFFAGYLPRQRRELVLAAEAQSSAAALPVVNVVAVERSPGTSALVLPGSIQAVTEAPVLARASGYVRKRYVDIGDRVAAGQLLAEIEAPELGQQVQQARAALEQTRSALEQSAANLAQGRTNEQLAKTTAQRWSNLAAKGVVSRQENDNYQAQYESQRANVTALEKAVGSARSNVAAAEANLARISQMQGYQKVRAPFSGVITTRNVDTGALIGEGSTLLFRIAQTDRLRLFVNVPQSGAGSVKTGQTAVVTLPDLPGREFQGVVTRTSNSLDPSTRTLLTEVQLPNGSGTLMPGMYAQVNLSSERRNPPLIIPSDTLVVRADGPQVAVVGQNRQVHFRKVALGRDYGEKLEVLSGLVDGERLVVNPGDASREGATVNPVLLKEKGGAKRPA